MSQKFGFACNDGDAPGIGREGGRRQERREKRWTSGKYINRGKSVFGIGSPHNLLVAMRSWAYCENYLIVKNI